MHLLTPQDSPISENVSSFVGLAIQCYTKGIFRDSELGVVTIRFNKALLNGESILSDWFSLTPKKKNVKSVGKLNLSMQFEGAVVPPQAEEVDSSTSESKEEQPKRNPLVVSSRWDNKNNVLKKSAFVVIDEDSAHSGSE